MKTDCTKCDGKGIVGAGDNPLALMGAVTICDVCVGKGFTETIHEAPIEDVPSEEPEAPESNDEPTEEATEETPVEEGSVEAPE